LWNARNATALKAAAFTCEELCVYIVEMCTRKQLFFFSILEKFPFNSSLQKNEKRRRRRREEREIEDDARTGSVGCVGE
jgi:hypothetical protein